ncbi:hypothetical protein BDB00DRAFT_931712 [Zychaea mexicana]|uniref:uncharacterized protein n=1 Tax=Zychaea mexicana TaxID=64656 RepID=UPI0022FE1C0D|nr:uncharacterized protein BDB00DRAFT_931712 [Zychaea mexicana]KAI9489743.1 hypothetical protein BDB00DRAFT_931712 [Zychaea mexicana]
MNSMNSNSGLDEPKSNRRNSAYVPVHRRTSSISDRPQDDEQLKRLSRKSEDTYDSRRSSRQFAWSRQQQQQQQQQQRNNQRYFDDGDDSDDVSIASTPANRFSRGIGGGGNDIDRRSADKLHYALENLLIHEEQQQDWEELLRQYDRYEDVEDIKAANRRSKRASRIMDPFSEPPAEVPLAEEPTVILDCHDFPSAFKTHHLHDIFREYENMRGGYRIKWMDDTRALIIFEHHTTAKKAYIDNVSNPLAKIRPYNGPTDFLKSPTVTQSPRRPTSIDVKRASYGGFGLKSPARPERQSLRGNPVMQP